MKLELINNNSDKLIIFLTGWGCDASQFSHLNSQKYDVLIIYDYNSLDFQYDFSKYRKINLLTFSAGVFISGVIKEKLPQFHKKIAINGNPMNFDKYYGPSTIFVENILNISKDTAVQFRRDYLVNDEKELSKFNIAQTKSCRGLEDCISEFYQIEKYYKSNFDVMDFDLVLLSDNDKVFNINKQLEYYNNKQFKTKVIENAAHYPFYKFNSYDEIFDMAK